MLTITEKLMIALIVLIPVQFMWGGYIGRMGKEAAARNKQNGAILRTDGGFARSVKVYQLIWNVADSASSSKDRKGSFVLVFATSEESTALGKSVMAGDVSHIIADNTCMHLYPQVDKHADGRIKLYARIAKPGSIVLPFDVSLPRDDIPTRYRTIQPKDPSTAIVTVFGF